MHRARIAQKRRRTEQQPVDDVEHRGIRTDAETEREHDADREARLRAKPAHRIADVGERGLDQRGAARVTALVLRAFDAAECQPREANGLVARDAVRLVSLGVALDVGAQLLVEIALDGAAVDEHAPTIAQIAPQLGQRHRRLPLRFYKGETMRDL